MEVSFPLTTIKTGEVITKNVGGEARIPPIKLGEIMQKYTYLIFDLDKINKAEDLFLNEMAHAGWDLFLINNEPMHEYPKVKVKLYFRKEVI